ncbi:MAG: TAXI family TRAP transporter solute-binding subunit [Cyanobacteria bacterium J06626_18]
MFHRFFPTLKRSLSHLRLLPFFTGLVLSLFLSWGCAQVSNSENPQASSPETPSEVSTSDTDATAAENYTVTLVGASPSGLWSLLGAGVDMAVKTAYPGSTVTYQTSGGGFANIPLLETGQAELGLAHDAELLMAREGQPPFEQPIESTRVLATLYTWAPMQVAVRKEFADQYGISTLQDLARTQAPARIALNKRGVVISDISLQMLEEAGVTEESLKSWGGDLVYAASSEQATLMQDRRIDIMTNAVFAGHSSFTQAGESLDLVMLPLDDGTIQTLADGTGSQPFQVPANTYSWQPDEVSTFAISASLIVDESMSNEDAYNLTKAIYENYDKVAEVHAAMKALTPEVMASNTVVPYHEGAIQYLQEAGLL